MILTCPECATSYFVDDLRIPRGGRMVKCTNCDARWRAYQDRAEAEADAESEREPAGDDLLVEEPPSAPPAAEDDIEFVAPPSAAGGAVAAPGKPSYRLVGAIAVGVTAALVVLGGLALLRQQVAAVLPQAAPIYAAVGLPVDMQGLVIEGVKSRPGFEAGRPVLAVTGAIRNTRKRPVQAPPIRISLLDRSGKIVGDHIYKPLNAEVPPGARRYFAVTLPTPPAGIRQLEVAFEPAVGQASHE